MSGPAQPRPSLSLVIPAFNEEAQVRETVAKCLSSLAAFSDRCEVIVVDDASTDRMPELLAELAREDERIHVLRNPLNLGAGTSLLVGLRAARHEIVLHDSMDYPFDLADLDKVLPRFAEADVVVVVRTDRAAHSAYRRVTSLVHYWLVRMLFGVPFRDMNFVQAYRREVAQSLAVKARSPAFVTPELLIRARDRGYKIVEAKATFHPRRKGQASYGKPRDILWTLADMLSFWLERRRRA